MNVDKNYKEKSNYPAEQKGIKEIFLKSGLIDSSSGLTKGPQHVQRQDSEQHGEFRKLLRAIRDWKATEWV